jgi:TetR/AcrR family transcriptional regulator, ethionamide resistance regulator
MSQLTVCQRTMSKDHRPQVAAQRRERMRLRLKQAAFSVAAHESVAAVTIDAVIARAQVARGSFYKYFDSPQSLLESVGTEVSDALLAAMRPVVSQLHPALAGFLARNGWPAASLTPLFNQVVGATLNQGMQQGRFSTMPLPLALSIVVGTLVGILHELEAHTSDALPEQTVTAILRALGLNAVDALELANLPLPLQASDLIANFVTFPGQTSA